MCLRDVATVILHVLHSPSLCSVLTPAHQVTSCGGVFQLEPEMYFNLEKAEGCSYTHTQTKTKGNKFKICDVALVIYPTAEREREHHTQQSLCVFEQTSVKVIWWAILSSLVSDTH